MILGPFADSQLDTLDGSILDQFEMLLEENDQDLYAWVTGTITPKTILVPILHKIRLFHGI